MTHDNRSVIAVQFQGLDQGIRSAQKHLFGLGEAARLGIGRPVVVDGNTPGHPRGDVHQGLDIRAAAQQQQALDKEPGFHDLPPQTQQRYRDRLAQLNTMPVQQRDKVLSRTEWMERLPPEQRSQVRNAMQQWSSLPPASHRAVGRTFRVVRGMPPAQRLAYLNSPDIRSQFSPQERDTLTHLMQVEPYLPPRNPNDPNF